MQLDPVKSPLEKRSTDENSQDSESERYKVVPEFKRYHNKQKHGKLVQFNKLSKRNLLNWSATSYNNDGPAFEASQLNFEMT